MSHLVVVALEGRFGTPFPVSPIGRVSDTWAGARVSLPISEAR